MSIERVTSGLWRLLQLPLCAKLNARISRDSGTIAPSDDFKVGRSGAQGQVNVPAIKSFGLRTCLQIGSAIFLAAVVCPCTNARAASPDDWQRLPDGRVVIQLKDVRVALPAAGPDTQTIWFYDRHHIRNRMSLKEVIERPAAAKQLFESAKLVSVKLPNFIDRSGLYLGKFPRLEFNSVDAGFAVGQGALAACPDWAQTVSRLSDSLIRNNRTLSPDGWAEFKLTERPIILVYVRSPRDASKTFFPGISCDPFKYCGSTKCLTPDLAASYSFSSRKIGQPNWLSLDEKMRRLLAYIFIDLKIEGGTK
jgi:hypothetical protein